MPKLCLSFFTGGSFFLLTPILAICLVLSYAYKQIVEILLRLEFKDEFVSLLNGTDYIWAIENSSALSVINVLVILEREQRPRCHLNVLENFRNLVRDRLLTSSHEKVFYRRYKRYGYYFWQRDREIDLKERVRWLDHEQSYCEGYCYEDIYAEPLRTVLEKVCNRPLPGDHTTSWEILIGKDCSRNAKRVRCAEDRTRSPKDRSRRKKIKIPVLFRIHRSLGDEADLMKLFLETIVEKSSSSTDRELPNIAEEEIKVKRLKDYHEITIEVPTFVKYTKNTISCEKDKMLRSYYEDVLSASMPFADLRTIRVFCRIFYDYLNTTITYFGKMTLEELRKEAEDYVKSKWIDFKKFLLTDVRRMIEIVTHTVGLIVLMPGYLMQQAVRNMEINSLHGPKLSGEKMIFYWLEDDFRDSQHQKLVTKVRDIKAICGAKFSEIFLAAFSSSLNRYLLSINEIPPDSVTVELPLKKEHEINNFSLKDEISIGELSICISKINGKSCLEDKDSRMIERLREIMRLNEKLTKDPNYVINCWIIKLLAVLLPEKFLKPMLENYGTITFNNLSECHEARILGHTVKNIVVWIPNRNKTGICFTILSYANRLQLSMLVDKALVKEDKIFSQILENTVREMDKLHENLTLTRFSRKFQLVANVPTDQDNGVL